MKKLILPILLIMLSCQKEEIKPDPIEAPKPVIVSTLEPSRIGQAFATVGGKVENAEKYTYGFSYGKSSSMMFQSTGARTGSGKYFNATINDLWPGTKYYYRAYVSYNRGGQSITRMGEVKSFTTVAY